MAEIVLSPLLQVVFDKLSNPILQTCANFIDLEGNHKSLEEALLMAQAVLEDAETQQVSNKAIKFWLSKLKRALYNAEDVLDLVLATQKNLSFGSSPSELRKTLQELETTAMGSSMFNLRQGNTVVERTNKRETGSYVTGSKIYGRKAEKEIIVNLLLSKDECFISIIGIGGIGKTTLAQLAYNDAKVTQKFHVKVWVFVSDDFEVKLVLKAIIESLTKSKCEDLAMDVLQSKLWALLHKKRYLIVLDDVWTEDAADWEKLELLSDIGIEGSKVLITTRNEKVASVISSPLFKYHLNGLAEDDCWKLFKNRAFTSGEEDEYPQLLPIGKVIIQKCGGIPLAAKQLGSSMRYKREETEWLYVQNSQVWNLDVGQTGILPALMLSYLHLPYHLKRCFEFCSVFPKRYEINKEKLIKMWMAQGLIQQPNGSGKQMEDVGEEYFQELVWASFFEDGGVSEDGSTRIFRMHNLMHDLAQSLQEEESLTLENERGLSSGNLSRIRHLYVICGFSTPSVPKAVYEKAHHLRTLIGVDTVEISSELPGYFPYLRILDLMASSIGTTHLWSYSQFRCLRYLDLSYTGIRSGNSIGKMSFLQTLNLCHCYDLESLPDVGNMADLRHLKITACKALTCMFPFRSGVRFSVSEEIMSNYLPKLNNQMQTLSTIIVANVFDMMFLGVLDLQGELEITGLHNLTSSDEAQRANLGRKDRLEKLELNWGDVKKKAIPRPIGKTQHSSKASYRGEQDPSQSQREANEAVEVMIGLYPHKNLKILLVNGFPGSRFPQWKLPNLTKVSLVDCKSCKRLPMLGNLLSLKYLFLQQFTSITSIGKEFYCENNETPFPLLHDLVIEDFTNLQEWFNVDKEDAFPSLKKLIVKNSPKLVSMPRFPSLQHLELRDFNAAVLGSIITSGPSSLTTLVIEKAAQLSSLPGTIFSSNSHLTCLEIISCQDLQCLPDELVNLKVLKSLKIRWCSELSFLPQDFQNLRALESLEITDCHSLTSMPEGGIGGLSSLRSLSIENCGSLVSITESFQILTSLEQLTVMYCPSLVSFPRNMDHLYALQSLTIISCPQIVSLPEELQNLRTLLVLEISSCPGLTILPEWIGNVTSLRSLIICDCGGLTRLPEGLKLLGGLQHLSIQECPQIQERCKRDDGEDWPKIAHVPHKYIGASCHGASSCSAI